MENETSVIHIENTPLDGGAPRINPTSQKKRMSYNAYKIMGTLLGVFIGAALGGSADVGLFHFAKHLIGINADTILPILVHLFCIPASLMYAGARLGALGGKACFSARLKKDRRQPNLPTVVATERDKNNISSSTKTIFRHAEIARVRPSVAVDNQTSEIVEPAYSQSDESCAIEIELASYQHNVRPEHRL